MWSRDVLEQQAICESPENSRAIKLVPHLQSLPGVSMATQTDAAIDLPAMEKFVLANPRLILNMLGVIEPAYQIECELQPQTLIPIPEAEVSSPEVSSPHNAPVNFSFGGEGSKSVPWSPHNSSNRHGENCRSTDALLGHSSDDCARESNTSLNNMNDAVNFSIVKEGSIKGKRKGQSAPSDGTRSERSSSSTSLTSAGNTPRASTSDLLTRHGSNNGGLHRKHSWKEGNGKRGALVTENRAAGESADDSNLEYDELSEKCALLCNDVRRNSRSSTTDIQKRTHLSMPRPPFNYRFSAGDADKLEKGIRNIPSTRSLKES